MAKKMDEENSVFSEESDQKPVMRPELENMKSEKYIPAMSDISAAPTTKPNTESVFKTQNNSSKPSAFSQNTGINSKSTFSMAPASFGKSSLSQAVSGNSQGSFGVNNERKFGSVVQTPTTGFGFKSVINSAPQNTNNFLASGSGRIDDDMGDDQDVFGQDSSNMPPPMQRNMPSHMPMNPGNMQSSLGFDPKSNPSFKQRRK